MSKDTSLQKPKFSVAIQTDGYKKLINNTLQDPARAQRFIASISSAVATNPNLQSCDAGTVLAGALLGESLNLSPSPQLGHYYLVPFKDRATFILGYKGYIQLALRSGQYRRLNVVAIKKDELVSWDSLFEEIEVRPIADELQREAAETIGYYAMFEFINGFRKAMYWPKSKMEQHAKRYSKAYHKPDSFWQKDFDVMAYKTMLRQLLSKWGIMSLEMQIAYESEDRVISNAGNGRAPVYLTGPDVVQITDDMNGAFESASPTEEGPTLNQEASSGVRSHSQSTISMDDL